MNCKGVSPPKAPTARCGCRELKLVTFVAHTGAGYARSQESLTIRVAEEVGPRFQHSRFRCWATPLPPTGHSRKPLAQVLSAHRSHGVQPLASAEHIIDDPEDANSSRADDQRREINYHLDN